MGMHRIPMWSAAVRLTTPSPPGRPSATTSRCWWTPRGDPTSGWRSTTGPTMAPVRMPVEPAWEQDNTQTSPGVFAWDGGWRMYYDAALAGHAAGTGSDCLSVATAGSLTPTDAVVHRLLHAALVVPGRPRRVHRPQSLRRPRHRRGLPGLEVQRRGVGPAGPAVVPTTQSRRDVPGGYPASAGDPGHRSNSRWRPPSRTPTWSIRTAPTSCCSRPATGIRRSYSEAFAICAGP